MSQTKAERERETEGVEVDLCFVCGCFGWSHPHSQRCAELCCVLWLLSVIRGGGPAGLASFLHQKDRS